MDYSSLGARIRRERVQRGWTQEQLAEKANISLSFLGHIERGTRKASLETLVSLANVLDASLDDLLKGSLTSRKKINIDKLPEHKQLILQDILRALEQLVSSWQENEQ